jgi:hypothetical protein
MTPENVSWMQHEVSFGVWDQEKCTGLLRIIPLGCELEERRDDPDALPFSAYGIYVRVKVEADGFECTGADFIPPTRFRELLHLLEGNPEAVKLVGDDGGVDVAFRWTEEGVVSVVGRIPAKGGARRVLLPSHPTRTAKAHE